MEIAFELVSLALVVLAATALAARYDAPAPLLLIVVGVGASYLPFVPTVHLTSDVVLLGLLPPLLYAAAIQTSLVDFNANRRSILLLSVGLVVFTTVGVGWLVHTMLPGLDWWASLAIGAVVAPPDAVAATSIGRRIGLPRRIVTILEGESLFNDATALVALRTAVAAGAGGVELWRVGTDFMVASAGGAVIGFAVFYVVARMRRHIEDPILDTAISFVIPYATYIASEELHSSGVVSVVVAGLLLGHKAPIVQTAQSRIAERMNWRTIAFFLENTVFLLIGLQASWILDDVGSSTVGTGRIIAVCALTLVAVVVLRILWVFVARYLLIRPGHDPDLGRPPPAAFTFLLGWAGMRGVVTLAAAFVIPARTTDREVLLLIAFTVVAGTLFIQGLSLPWLTRRLRVPSPDPMEDALARATVLQQASKAGFKRLHELEYDDPHDVFDLLKQRIEQRNFAAWERLGTTADQETPTELYSRVRLEMIDAERSRVLEMRRSGTIASEVISEVLSLLDVEESMLDISQQNREEQRFVASVRRTGAACEHLEANLPIETVAEPECGDCLREGTTWVALRQCLECGNVGCCDSSPRRHATRHFHETQHPVMQSAEPGEDWRWCYVHHLTA
ncbi:MAG: monovalent cation/hydrogen antiporter [Nocardioidaceae bacterium]|nr:monovalent cation/hydrogen antiporter [Nocardioidaceae bacterium]